MSLALPKLKAAILYFAENTESQYLGKVKLMKLLYFLDFEHLKRFGKPVLGDEYFHLEMGPIPTVAKNLVDTLLSDPESSKLADSIRIKTFPDIPKQEIVAQRNFTEADKDEFTPSEFEVLVEVAKRFRDTDTQDIIDASHGEAAWYKTEYLQKIPYELAAFDSNSSFTSKELKFLDSL